MRKTFFFREAFQEEECWGHTCLKDKGQIHMATENHLRGQDTDIRSEPCGNAASQKDNVITGTCESLKRKKY